MNNKFTIKPHHKLIADALERVERWELKKLIICMPPRSGKSHITSELFPIWYLWKHPDRFIINSAYSADLSNQFSRRARNMINESEYKFIFDTELSNDSTAVNQWHTDWWGGYISAGVWWPITGKGWHILITDDPLKNSEEADSELIRNKIWDWYQTTLRTRKMDENTAEIVMMTRWHEDDLVWRLLAQEKDWEVIVIPALNKEWESYWEERFSTEYFAKFKTEIWPRAWSALYMQEPQPEGWWLFKREYFKYYSQVDITKIRKLTFVDPAISEKQTADYTAIITIWISWNNILILDVRRGRLTPSKIIDEIFDVVKQFNPEAVWIESIAYQKMLIQEVRKAQALRWQSFVIREIHPTGEKNARISSTLENVYSTGRLWHPANQLWTIKDLEAELLSFPFGKHDDLIDALSSVMRLVSWQWVQVFKKD
jgi:predicted phage terminase large subunit-like protein